MTSTATASPLAVPPPLTLYNHHAKAFDTVFNQYRAIQEPETAANFLKYRSSQIQHWYSTMEIQFPIAIEAISHSSEATQSLCTSFEQCTTQYLAILEKIGGPPSLQPASVQPSVHENVKLPRLTLHRFSGRDVTEWVSFKNLFESVIDKNPTLSDTVKLQYLLSHVSDLAHNLISHLPLAAESYPLAKQLLWARFDNASQLSSAHYDRLLDLTPCKDTSISLQTFVDGVRMNIASLKSLREDVDQLPYLIFKILEKKVPGNVMEAFLCTREDKNLKPSYKMLLDFLMERATSKQQAPAPSKSTTTRKTPSPKQAVQLLVNPESSLPRSHSNTPRSPPQARKNTTPVYSSGAKPAIHPNIRCHGCDRNHYTYSCSEFLELSPRNRYHRVLENEGCVLCLSRTHSLEQCPKSRPCRHCGSPNHHHLLHFATQNKSRPSYPSTSQSNSPRSRSPNFTNRRSEFSSSSEGRTSPRHLHKNTCRCARSPPPPQNKNSQ